MQLDVTVEPLPDSSELAGDGCRRLHLEVDVRRVHAGRHRYQGGAVVTVAHPVVGLGQHEDAGAAHVQAVVAGWQAGDPVAAVGARSIVLALRRRH